MMFVKDIAEYEENDSNLAKLTIMELQQENQQLKEQLEKNKLNHKQLKDLEIVQLLNSHQVERISKLEEQLKQRDEIIDEAIEYLKCNAVYDEEYDCNFEGWLDNYESGELFKILNKYKGDNNDK